VVDPNNDTLYSAAWLDLRAGPQVLTVPAISARYSDFQLLDMYSNTFADVGVLTDGGQAGRYAFVGPGWQGPLPSGIRRIDAQTPDVWLLGRTGVDGPDDLTKAVALQREYGLATLQPASASTAADGRPACGPTPTAISQGGLPLFDEISADMAADPPPAEDGPVVSAMARAGVGPGLHPSATTDQAVLAGLREGLRLGPLFMAQASASAAKAATGWQHNSTAGSYGTDYVTRARVAASGLGAQLPSQAAYFTTTADVSGQPLSGVHRYDIHFAKGQLPPHGSAGFWSLTMYNQQRYLVANPLQRYSIGDHTPGLGTNADGSLDITLAATAPTAGSGVWLPAPNGQFSVTLRVYAPSQNVTTGVWAPPPVLMVS
jgi:hypothetical protein